jgi:hypothetical protein
LLAGDDMAEKSFLLKLTGAFVFGLILLILAAVLVYILSPYIIPFFQFLLPFLGGVLLFVLAILVIWAIIFIVAYIGILVYTAIKHPMKVKKTGNYSVDQSKESGRREEGEK